MMLRAFLLLLTFVFSACSSGSDSIGDGDTEYGDDLDVVWSSDGDITPDGDMDADDDSIDYDPTLPDRPYRPAYHYTPASGWMNDPNGLVVVDGVYHLFHQYAPEGFWFSSLHWGHATSTDLVHWQRKPIAISPDETLGQIYSGSAVVDAENTSGLCKADSGTNCVIAIYTHAGGDDGKQKQSLAVSNDAGETFVPYEHNPVLSPPEGFDDFRDPKVFWHADSSAWVMALAAGDRVRFYRSSDLISWEHTSDFMRPEESEGGMWECPDLLFLPILGESNKNHWVLKVDLFIVSPTVKSGGRYFIGDFDGSTFTPDPDQPGYFVDFGSDFYAAQSWSNPASDTVEWIAWMNDWSYALSTPTEPWQGQMALPRTVSLSRDLHDQLRLTQKPVQNAEYLRDATLIDEVDREVTATTELATGIGAALEITADWEIGSARTFGFNLREGDSEYLQVGYVKTAQTLYVDRRVSGAVDFHQVFPAVHSAPYESSDGLIRLHIFLDWSSVEVFADEGRIVISDLVFPATDSQGLSAFVEGGTAKLVRLRVDALAPALDGPAVR